MNSDVYQQLLTSLASSDGQEAELDLPALVLQQMGDANPAARAIAAYLARRQAAESERLAADDAEHAPPLAEDRANSPSGRPSAGGPEHSLNGQVYRRLQRVVRDMYDELEDLRERNDTLSAALGACYLCWGENPTCEVCHGRGQPGSSMPDKELFRQFVLPAMRAIKAAAPERKVPLMPQ